MGEEVHLVPEHLFVFLFAVLLGFAAPAFLSPTAHEPYGKGHKDGEQQHYEKDSRSRRKKLGGDSDLERLMRFFPTAAGHAASYT